MWGINPFTVGKIVTGVVVSSAVLGKHGTLKQLTRKIRLYVSEQNSEAAKAMARSIALQDQSLYRRLKKELACEISPDEYEHIFGDPCDPPPH